MRVTIITVSLNSAESVEACIRSVIRQTHREIEYISVDGRSEDGTLDVINKYRDHFAARLCEKDDGIYEAMNKGLALAGGELVGFLNSDDVLAADDIIARVVEVVAGGRLDSCYGDIVYVDPTDSGRTIRYWKAGPFDAGNIKKGWMPPHPAFFVRRSIYQRFGGFNLAFPVIADYEIMLRFLYKHRISSSYLPRIILRKSTGGISKPTLPNVIRNNAACHKAWIANGLRPSWKIFARKILSKLIQLRPLP